MSLELPDEIQLSIRRSPDGFIMVSNRSYILFSGKVAALGTRTVTACITKCITNALELPYVPDGFELLQGLVNALQGRAGR